MRAVSRTPVAFLALALVVLAAGCAVLPPPPGPVPPSGRTVTCITRTLADGLHLQVLEHRVRVVHPDLVAFLEANPGLEGRMTLPDLLFLERLAESNRRGVLRASAASPADVTDRDPTLSDRLDAVERIKVVLLREALRFPVFLGAIAGVIGDDALDPESEHGGLVILESGGGMPAVPDASSFIERR